MLPPRPTDMQSEQSYRKEYLQFQLIRYGWRMIAGLDRKSPGSSSSSGVEGVPEAFPTKPSDNPEKWSCTVHEALTEGAT